MGCGAAMRDDAVAASLRLQLRSRLRLRCFVPVRVWVGCALGCEFKDVRRRYRYRGRCSAGAGGNAKRCGRNGLLLRCGLLRVQGWGRACATGCECRARGPRFGAGMNAPAKVLRAQNFELARVFQPFGTHTGQKSIRELW